MRRLGLEEAGDGVGSVSVVGDEVFAVISGEALGVGKLENGRFEAWVNPVGQWVAPQQMVAPSDVGRDALGCQGSLLIGVNHEGMEWG